MERGQRHRPQPVVPIVFSLFFSIAASMLATLLARRLGRRDAGYAAEGQDGSSGARVHATPVNVIVFVTPVVIVHSFMRRSRASRLLEERYVRGEIDDVRFRTMRNNLES